MTKVLLYSGGMDSFCLYYIIKPDVAVYVNLDTRDGKRELEKVKQLPFEVKIIDIKDLAQFELSNKIIPHRNAIMALLAAQYGNNIYMGVTGGDNSRDKDYIFKSQVEGILNYFSADKSHEVVNVKDYPYTLEMPFKEITKAEILATYLKEGGKVEDILKYSRSCYEGGEKECGTCRNCMRKWVAFELNDINTDDIFETNPLEVLTEADARKLASRGKEGEDFIKLINKLGYKDLESFISNLEYIKEDYKTKKTITTGINNKLNININIHQTFNGHQSDEDLDKANQAAQAVAKKIEKSIDNVLTNRGIGL